MKQNQNISKIAGAYLGGAAKAQGDLSLNLASL